MDSALDLKNGLLSYSNPNYKVVEQDDPNDEDEGSNYSGESEYDEEDEASLYQEIKVSPVCRLNRKPSVRNRRKYAQLDINSMGVDLDSDLTSERTSLLLNNSHNNVANLKFSTDVVPDYENNIANKNLTKDSLDLVNVNEIEPIMVRRKINQSENGPDDKDYDAKMCDEMCQSATDMALTPDSCTSSTIIADDGIPHIPGQMNNDLYAIPVKCKSSAKTAKTPDSDDKQSAKSPGSSIDHSSISEASEEEYLPHGWEKHEDIDGPYFWHIKSGTIQREPPKLPFSMSQQDIRQLTHPPGPTTSPSAGDLNPSHQPAAPPKVEETLDDVVKKRHSCPPSSFAPVQTNNKAPQDDKFIRFAVRSLGWVEIAEEDLTPDRSSKAVNKCIVDLSYGKNEKLDAIGRWGEGKDLYMDLDNNNLKLVSPIEMKILNMQPIHSIRVWGVGRDNGRDFAYVARDRISRRHMCHVFRCDTPARTIANTLRDICKKIMIERSMTQNLAKPIETSPPKNNRKFHESKLAGIHRSHVQNESGPTRPNNLPVDHKTNNNQRHLPASHMFPTPMEEPKKMLKAYYLGSEKVHMPTGIDVLNDAIDKKIKTVPPDKWQHVSVSVAPSTISIYELNGGRSLAECRVRFLSFLGIGKNIQNCAFIMHTAQDEFIAYVFHCEPSSGAICKTIEAACKLRYQKCLDSHHVQGKQSRTLENESKGLGTTIKNMLGSLTGKKSKSMES